MRKRIIEPSHQGVAHPNDEWLDLEALAEVEITSEDPAHPIESALLPGQSSGWRAANTGPQTVRLLFAAPRPLRRILLQFEEPDTTRTQEYVLRWSADGGKSFSEIVRQQWNFSPDGATTETADYRVDLDAVTMLELNIIPDISGRPVLASLTKLRLA